MPVDSATLCEQGYVLLMEGRLEEARACLEQAAKLSPDDPRIHYRLALVHTDSGRPVDALAELDIAIRLDPMDPRAHNNRGSALQLLARLGDAENAFRRALELAPGLAPPYVNLGNLYELQGRHEKAVTIYERAIAHGLDAEMFGQYIAAVRGKTTTRSPDSWVRATFDNFAPTFNAHLSALQYHVPQDLAAMVRPHLRNKVDILDLGCGTGQCGVALGQSKRRLVGVDLSPQMLAKARATKMYDDLYESEITDWLRQAEASTVDMVVACDVFIYIGMLDDIFRGVTRVLRLGGLLCFSTEEVDNGDYTLLPTGRYAQSLDYIRRLAGGDYAFLAAQKSVIRINSGAPIHGRLYVLRRR